MVYRNRNTSDSRNRLSDRDMLLDMLATGKNMSHLYDHAIMEASSGMVRETFETLQHDEHMINETLYGIMQEEGWYSTGASGQQAGQGTGGSRRRSSSFSTQASSRYAVRSGSPHFGGSLSGMTQSSRGKNSRSQVEWTL